MNATIVKFEPKGGGFDPVYSTIQAHRTAIRNLDVASHISVNSHDAASHQLSEATCALLTCQPTTMEGLLTLLDYVGPVLSGGSAAKKFSHTIAAALRNMIKA